MAKAFIKTIFFLFILNSFSAIGQSPYSVDQIPDPKQNGGGYVSNPDRILTSSEVATIDSKISSLESETNAQIAVVVVNNFNEDQDDFEFALQLFNRWGIGAKESNNGLLLLIAKDRRKYRFITGTGLEGLLPDVKLRHIGEQQLVPAFRENDYGNGIINALDAINLVLLKKENYSEINQIFSNPKKLVPSVGWLKIIGVILLFILVFYLFNKRKKNFKEFSDNKSKYKDDKLLKGCGLAFLIVFSSIFVFIFLGPDTLGFIFRVKSLPITLYVILGLVLFTNYKFALSRLKQGHTDPKNSLDAVATFNKSSWWLLLFSPLVLESFVSNYKKSKKSERRFLPVLDSHQKEMQRVDRDENPKGKPYLTDGQKVEEHIEVYEYDIWLSQSGDQPKIIANEGKEFSHFSLCPSCNFKTFSNPKTKTISAATYSSTGTAKLIQVCENCSFELFIRNIALAMLVRSTSSSSSGSRSSSSSSSSSRSSWGGGSSSGGGAGGSW